MSNFNTNDLNAIAFLCDDFIEKNKISAAHKETLQGIKEKCKDKNPMRFVPLVSSHMKEDITTMCGQAEEIIEEYAGMVGDMSLINEYDELKKKSLVVLSRLADMSSEMKAKADFADDKLRSFRAALAISYMEQGKSAAAADVLSRAEDAYLTELNNLEEYVSWTTRVRNKYAVLEATNKSLIQSVSTARVGMIKDSYND